ncbi:hypothetical protein SPV1_09063 [Mariprofundus ferrooxydans PV-1]|uniref:Uncharacterized protein n=1 Tax=Mariprofundus ferrooxydans PV-1 TaxID=314345 RepID=Q0F052_9PROT|nr:hypothetical protein SPV1_09063 [Mariprofundus ferrooxydans PV-1]
MICIAALSEALADKAPDISHAGVHLRP